MTNELILYSIDNVQKFVDENLERLGVEQAGCILRRAYECADEHVLKQETVNEIFGTPELAQEFEQTVRQDTEHTRIALAAIRQL